MTLQLTLGRRIVLSVAALVAGVTLIVTVSVPGALGAYTARITNSANTVSTNPYFTCGAAVSTDPQATFSYNMDDTGTGLTMADDSGNNRPGAYSAAGVTYRQAGPCPRDSALGATFNGSTGFAYGPNTTYNPSTFSEEIWFRTSTGGGKLMGLGNSRTGTSTQYDRHVYLTNAGNVVFGVYPGAVKTVQSPSTYLDNKWHHVVATQGLATNANPGIRLYVDGALVASDSTVVTNENAAEYFRVGYDNINSWGVTQPNNFYFTGTLAWAGFYATTALTPTQVKQHYSAGV